MKKIVFLTLLAVLCLTLDANAFHRRLLHRPAAQGGMLLPFNQAPGLAMPPFLGGSPPAIEVPRQVLENIKASDKNLTDASALLNPLLVKYNLIAASPPATTAVTPIGPALQTLTSEQDQELLRIFSGQKKQP